MLVDDITVGLPLSKDPHVRQTVSEQDDPQSELPLSISSHAAKAERLTSDQKIAGWNPALPP